jgi:signal transduction histidine kinase
MGIPGLCQSRRRDRSRPRFLWQGLLIILPAVVLAAAGLSSLRQDRVLAEHEAAETAKKFATELEQSIAAELRIDLPRSTDIANQMREEAVEDDPVARAAAGATPCIAVRLSEARALEYPVAMSAPPTPRPLLATALSGAQEEAWIALQTLWIRAPKAADVETGLTAFVALNPPEQWAAVARFRSALAAHEKGDDVRAAALFRAAAAQAGAVTESGFDLRPFAELELAAIAPETRLEGIQRVCRHLVSEPTVLTPILLRRAESLSPNASRWTQLFQQHERARAFFETLSQNDPNRVETIWLDGKEFFPLETRVESGSWVLGLSRDDLARTVARVVAGHAPPDHFGVAMSLTGKALIKLATREVPLATSAAVSLVSLDVHNGGFLLMVQVFLTEPDRFFAKQRARTIRFGALITVSAAAVFLGFITAWRAFRRQEQLSELKTNFVSSVSHELRAPIASVRLMAEELENGSTPTREKLREYHRFIGQECRRLSALIENVLDFSRREQGREEFLFTSTDLRALFEETVSVMEIYAAEKEVSIEKEVHGEAVPMIADGRALQRLLINLLDNAIKHSPQGAAVRVGLRFEDQLISLWVEDSGPGIPSSEQEHIFERFYRIGSELRRETPGVGLGLSIVKRIVEVHRGRVHVRSGEGSGSRFTVELPVERDLASTSERGAFA